MVTSRYISTIDPTVSVVGVICTNLAILGAPHCTNVGWLRNPAPFKGWASLPPLNKNAAPFSDEFRTWVENDMKISLKPPAGQHIQQKQTNENGSFSFSKHRNNLSRCYNMLSLRPFEALF